MQKVEHLKLWAGGVRAPTSVLHNLLKQLKPKHIAAIGRFVEVGGAGISALQLAGQVVQDG